MKKLLLTIAIAVGLGALGAIFYGLYGMADASPQETFVFAVPNGISDRLPECIPSVGDCRWKLWRLQRQRSSTVITTWDAWAKYRDKYYHAHVQRRSSATHWLWVISGHPYWLKAIRRYKVDNPLHVTHGPALMVNVRKNPTICDIVAPLLFVPITTDGGALKQPNPTRHSCNAPSDAGAGDCTVTQRLWPDGGAVANCASKFWLAKSIYGGRDPWNQAEEDAGFLVDAASVGGLTGVRQSVNPNSWIAPDARVSHQCTLPAATPCP